jgi:hypothetical protein
VTAHLFKDKVAARAGSSEVLQRWAPPHVGWVCVSDKSILHHHFIS